MYVFKPSNLSGTIELPYSKSTLHRALICALLSQNKSVIKGVNLCEDINATLDILVKIGCKIKKSVDEINIDSRNLLYDGELLNAQESGSTLRFMIPVIIHLFKQINITGSEKLMSRPLDVYFSIFEDDEIEYELKNNILTAKGFFNNKHRVIDNTKSSQFVTGMVLILPFYHYSSIEFTNHDSSMGYIDLTLQIQNKFGLKMYYTDILTIKNFGGKYSSCIYENEADESSKAFYDFVNYTRNNEVKFKKINDKSNQPDAMMFSYMVDKPNSIDIDRHPDILPILIVWAIYRGITIEFENCARTIYKESDRLNGFVGQLKDFGLNYKIDLNNKLIIFPSSLKHKINIKSNNDHRIAMSAIMLSTIGYEVTLDDIGCINKSYPNFIDDYKKLGGKINL